ncbi:hypothetical protein [Prevotella sp.]|uniref:hypothetical protein n=1 Tax=Prevotella sp. TaxID=59823 RepID=UPI002E772D20|nr:hypothetical protein [Prevotella sp.]MEE0669135.1 hypothetical protein [Prevotella sp.]
MKKFTLVALAMMASASCFAQTTLWDGENPEISNKDYAGFWSDGKPELCDNLETNGINNSAHCLKFTINKDSKVVKLPFREWMKPSMNGSKRISLMIKKNVNENVCVELSDPTDGSVGYWKKQVVWYSGDNKWQKLVFDFSSNGDFDNPGIMTITAQTNDFEGEQTVYIDNIVIEDAPRINGKLFSEYNAENPITGDLKLTGAWMKGASLNADADWKENTYNDFEYFNSHATDGVTSVDMRGTVTKDVDVAQFFKNPNTIVYADAAYDHANVVVNGTATNLLLTDANAFNAPYDFTAESVKLTRSLQNGINSFVLPFEVSANELGANKIATYKNCVLGNVANFETAESVVANTPFLTTDAKEASELTFTNKSIVATPENLGTDFVGVYTRTKAQGKYGIDEKGNLHKGGADAYVNPFHACLNVEGVASVAFDGSVTAINNIAADKVANTAVYDLSGRRVNGKLQKGLYIMNGKKVVVK